MDWSGKRVLITGISGFVGSSLAKTLVEKGAKVTGISYGDTANIISKTLLGFEGVFDKVEFIECDIRDYEKVKNAFDKGSPEVVFHLAAQAIVGVANKSPIPTFEVNIMGTGNILEVIRNSDNIEAVAVASTDKVYGDIKEGDPKIKENHKKDARYPYEASKLCAETLAKSYFYTYGIPIGVTHCANIYGGGDLNFSRIVPDTVKSVILNKSPIIRSDGTPIREFLYIDDAVSAYLVLAENLHRKEVQGKNFNFGNGKEVSILGLVNQIIIISGKNLKPNIKGKGTPSHELSVQYLDSSEAKKVLNWESKVSREEGLKKTIDWYTRYFEWNPDAKEL